jgi:predicted secreted protein
MVVKSTATIAVTSESWDTDSPAGIVMVFSVSASEPDEVDAADAVDVLLLVSEEPVDPHAVSASAVAAATRARITCLFFIVVSSFSASVAVFFVLSFHR